jgi:exopolysaccharide biosynthesis polyprenyl glycosylphosphotransferase
VLIVGTGARALRLYRELVNGSRANYRVLGFVDGPNGHLPHRDIRQRILGDLRSLEPILVNNVVDEVLITLPVKSCYAQIEYVISVAERVGVESKYLSEIFPSAFARVDYERLEGFPFTSLKPAVDDGRLVIKRAIDFTGALIGLVSLSPLLALIAIAIRFTDGGPVIFSQERYGRNKRQFKMHKFRTMVRDAEALQKDLEHRNEVTGPVFKIREDPRVTKLGRLLRRSSLDELPQLFNVLKGEMSLVGPRPLPLRDVLLFEESWLMRRFSVTPGISGLWQVNGRSHMSFDKWVASDLKYIDDWSLSLDVKILIKTVPAALKGIGAV